MDTKHSRSWLACAFLGALILSVPVWGSDAQAECRVVSTAPSYLLGKLQSISCDPVGRIGVGGGPGSATEVAPTLTEGTAGYLSFDLRSNLRITKGTQDGGEHIGATEAEGYQIVRGNLLSSGQKTADAQIKATPGYVSHMTCQGSDAAAVAGTIILHDATTETGTAMFTFTVAALDYHNPMVFPIMADFATGIYLGYTTTSDMACTVFYR